MEAKAAAIRGQSLSNITYQNKKWETRTCLSTPARQEGTEMKQDIPQHRRRENVGKGEVLSIEVSGCKRQCLIDRYLTKARAC
jgi:hypothetical protein